MSLSQRLPDIAAGVLIAANALPILGVFAWGWDELTLMLMYRIESAIIGFRTLLLIFLAPLQTLGDEGRKPKAASSSVAFFALHGGIFMAAHFAVMTHLFAAEWARQTAHGGWLPESLTGHRVWIPLAALFFVRGFTLALPIYGPRWFPDWFDNYRPIPPDSSMVAVGRPLFSFYARILAMQFALLGGAWLMQKAQFGSMAPLLVLIAVKSAIDIAIYIFADRPERNASAAPRAA